MIALGQHVQTERGAGIVEHIYGTVRTAGDDRIYTMCTVKLDIPYLDRREKVVTRIEALIREEEQ